jgi:hypothetical protein
VNPPEIFDGAIDNETIVGLERAILGRAEPGRPYPGGANRGGWKSGVDLLSWPEPAIGKLRGVICGMLDRRGFSVGGAWSVVNKNGSWHGRHRHGTPIMGIAFVTSGDPRVPTVFEVGHRYVEVEPIPGRIVLCGDLYHYVPVYHGGMPRIAVAFDGRFAG